MCHRQPPSVQSSLPVCWLTSITFVKQLPFPSPGPPNKADQRGTQLKSHTRILCAGDRGRGWARARRRADLATRGPVGLRVCARPLKLGIQCFPSLVLTLVHSRSVFTLCSPVGPLSSFSHPDSCRTNCSIPGSRSMSLGCHGPVGRCSGCCSSAAASAGCAPLRACLPTGWLRWLYLRVRALPAPRPAGYINDDANGVLLASFFCVLKRVAPSQCGLNRRRPGFALALLDAFLPPRCARQGSSGVWASSLYRPR